MADLHKPSTPGPWRKKWFHIWAVNQFGLEDEEVADVETTMSDAAAIADLWGWIERAERFEEALREIAEGWAGSLAEYVSEFAADALREEGRL